MPAIPNILIDSDGTMHTIYTEELDLYELGQLGNVRRASWLVFDEPAQEWTVRSADTGETVHRTRSRADAINWEIRHFSPGGKHYVS